jgi:hypothetical protein
VRRTRAAILVAGLVTAGLTAVPGVSAGGQTTTTAPTPTATTPAATTPTTPTTPTNGGANGQGVTDNQKVNKVTLTPDETSRAVPFGLKRDPKTITLTYQAPTALPAGTVIDVVVADLRGSHDVFPSSQITATATLVGGGSTVKVVATFDPKNVDTGRYSGEVRLASTTVEAPAVALTTNLETHSGSGYLLAFIVIALGVLVGLITKWLADSGTQLGALRARLADLSFDLNALRAETLPPAYQAAIAHARRVIDRGDANGAKPLVDKVTGAEDAVVALASRLALMEDALKLQRSLIAASAVDDPTKGRLRGVIDIESAWVPAIAAGSWPDPAATQADQQEKAKWVEGYNQFLRRYLDASTAERQAPPLKPALDYFTSGDFASALTALQQPAAPAQPPMAGSLGALVAADATLAAPGADGTGPPTSPIGEGRMAKLRRLLSDNAGLLTALLFGLLVTLVGLTELYSKHPDAGEAISDWVAFFGWGFAIELTGITAAQAALRLAPGATQ